MKTIYELAVYENHFEAILGYFWSKLELEIVAKGLKGTWIMRERVIYLSSHDYDQNSKAARKKRVLEKLTGEELELLGLTMEG